MTDERETPEQRRLRWGSKAAGLLIGKTVMAVRYLSPEEMEGFGWDASAVVIEFTDGSWVCPSRDDEGNGPGALFTSFDNLPTIPVIYGS
jgi:hypothetical protein